MNTIRLGHSTLNVSRIALGCMRMANKTVDEAAAVIDAALAGGINFFDHADIYGAGESEIRFRDACDALNLQREDVFLQSKCGIRKGYYDFSYSHIMKSVDGILERLGTDYLDVLLLHRPDTLLEPDEVAEAFSELKAAGKVRWFGVSNQNPRQMELTFSRMEERPVANQLQMSLEHADLVTNGLTVNMSPLYGADHSGYVLDYCRLNNVTVQAWSPLQFGMIEGSFMDAAGYNELNTKLTELAAAYDVAPEGIAIAWLLRHPAQIQPVIGTMTPERISNICNASDIQLSREEWYAIYQAAGHMLP